MGPASVPEAVRLWALDALDIPRTVPYVAVLLVRFVPWFALALP
jgi:hypothetical protein